MHFGLLQTVFIRSAWNFIRRLLALAPPSTLRLVIGVPASSSIARMTSMDWKAMDSSAARAMWAAVAPRVRPQITPWA